MLLSSARNNQIIDIVRGIRAFTKFETTHVPLACLAHGSGSSAAAQALFTSEPAELKYRMHDYPKFPAAHIATRYSATHSDFNRSTKLCTPGLQNRAVPCNSVQHRTRLKAGAVARLQKPATLSRSGDGLSRRLHHFIF